MSPRVALGVFAAWLAAVALAGCSSGAVAARPSAEDAPVRSESANSTSEARDAGPPDAAADAPVTAIDAAAGASRRRDGGTYQNPVVAHDFPDPFVLREGATYYAFATNSNGKNVQAARSTDLAKWADLPDALPTLPAWAEANVSLVWAPSVLKRGATYVMYYVAHHTASGFQCISRAVATQPEGPYEDASDAPLICQVAGIESFCGSIDPSPFVDETGTPYLLWKSDENAPECGTPPRIWVQRLTDDGYAMTGPRTVLLAKTEAWERPLIEGPSMVACSGKYFLFYSANAYESASYGVGYAVCDAVTGPCVKKTLDRTDGSSPALVHSSGTVLGPGGQEFFTDDRGKLWMAYHAWTSPWATYASGGSRSMRIDPIDLTTGAPVLAAPTTDIEQR